MRPEALSTVPKHENIEMDEIETPKIPSTFTSLAVEMVITTLDEFVAIKTADRPLTGWSGVTSANFSAVVTVIPTAANEIRDPALWLYVASFVDTVLWQGLSKYIVTGTLNMELTDQDKVKERGYTEESQFDTIFAPYSDTIHVPGPTKILLVIVDASSRSYPDAVTVGPIGNSITANVRKAGSTAIPTRVTNNILRALTGKTWTTWPTVEKLSDPGEDEWYQANKMLEHYVCVEDVLDIAAGVVTATTFRMLAPHIDRPIDNGIYRTHQGSWLMQVTRYSAPDSEDTISRV